MIPGMRCVNIMIGIISADQPLSYQENENFSVLFDLEWNSKRKEEFLTLQRKKTGRRDRHLRSTLSI